MYSENNEDQILKRELEIENNLLIQNISQFKYQVQEKEKEIEELKKENSILKNENIITKESYKNLQDEYNKIIYSRSYKITRKIINIIKGR